MVITRPTQPKSQNGTYVFIEKAKNSFPNQNRKCFFCKTTSWIWILQNSKLFIKKKISLWPSINSSFWCIVLPERLEELAKATNSTASVHFCKYLCDNTHDFSFSYCLGYWVKFRFTCKEKFLWRTFKAQT